MRTARSNTSNRRVVNRRRDHRALHVGSSSDLITIVVMILYEELRKWPSDMFDTERRPQIAAKLVIGVCVAICEEVPVPSVSRSVVIFIFNSNILGYYVMLYLGTTDTKFQLTPYAI